MDPDEFLQSHRRLHEQQRARLLLLRTAFLVGTLIVLGMLAIAMRAS